MLLILYFEKSILIFVSSIYQYPILWLVNFIILKIFAVFKVTRIIFFVLFHESFIYVLLLGL